MIISLPSYLNKIFRIFDRLTASSYVTAFLRFFLFLKRFPWNRIPSHFERMISFSGLPLEKLFFITSHWQTTPVFSSFVQPPIRRPQSWLSYIIFFWFLYSAHNYCLCNNCAILLIQLQFHRDFYILCYLWPIYPCHHQYRYRHFPKKDFCNYKLYFVYIHSF